MNVPDGWRAVSLGDVVRPETRREVPTQPLPYIGMEHVEAGSGRITATSDASAIRSSSPLVGMGDVLYGRLRPYLNKVAIAPQGAYASGEFIVFRGNDEIDARFLKWRLTAEDFVRFATALNSGDRPRVKWPQMAGFRFPLPPLPEQRRIVEMVEEQMAHLDAADATLASAEQRLTYAEVALARSYFDRDTGDGSAWRWSTIGDECSVAVGATPKRSEPSLWGGDIPWVSSGEVAFTRITDTREHISETALGDRSKRLHPPGTVLLAMIGEGRTRGQAAILETWAAHNQNCASIRTAGSSIHPNFLYLFLKYKYAEVRAGGSGGNQPALNKARVRAIPIPVPPLAEQLKIAAAMEAWAEQAHRTTSAIVTQRRKSAALRRSVLAAAFSGHLTSTTDPSDLLQESIA